MTLEHVNHSHIVRFAENVVNLPSDKARQLRKKASHLTDRLEEYLSDDKDFSLRRMLISGSLAKGTALEGSSDVDVACYISETDSNRDLDDLKEDLVNHFQEDKPKFNIEKVECQEYSVKITLGGTEELDIDVVPILYDGNCDWYGELVSQDDGSFLETNIPFHIKFIKKRKKEHGIHFAQVARLLKFWSQELKENNNNFRFKSFMIELILAHLCDSGSDISNYPEALQAFFTYIIRSRLEDKIVFSDYYGTSKVGKFNDRIQIIDPVNAKNNVALGYTEREAQLIIKAADDAGDAICSAKRAIDRNKTTYFWRKVFGDSFST